MSEVISGALDWLADSSPRWLRYVGVRQGARAIRRRMGRAVIGFGATFFSSREALEQSRNFGEFLGSAERIDAIYVVGRSFIRDHSDRFRRIRRLILPDPTSASFKFYEQSTGEPNLAEYVVTATQICRTQIGIQVRWCPELIQQSVLIGDSDKRSGWVHAELVMPYSRANARPSITVKKSRFERVVSSYQETFNLLWALSKEPPAQIEPSRKPSELPKPEQNNTFYPPEVTSISPDDLIRSHLKTPGWILNFNPDNASKGRKFITFEADGMIGEGHNPKEYRWVVRAAQLEIYRQTGALQNRFRYDRETHRFICTNAPEAQGLKNQVIFRQEVGLTG